MCRKKQHNIVRYCYHRWKMTEQTRLFVDYEIFEAVKIDQQFNESLHATDIGGFELLA
jgi:hypothetical protein